MKLADLTVEVRDINLVRLGQIVPQDLDLLLEDQYNNVGSWTLVVATNHPLAEALRTPGAGIIVTRSDGTVVLSGPTIKPEDAATTTDPGGTLTVEGLTDTVILADRLAFPEPSNVDPETQTLSHDVRTGNAEALMHAYVNANIGPGAPSARRDTRLVMGTNSNRGSTMTKRARFPVLGSLLAEIAAVDGLGFRVIQVGSNLEFQTYAVADRTDEIRLDIHNNTLAGHRVAIGTPSITRAVVAGQGEQVDRQFVEVTTADSLAAETLWRRRIEQFVDQRQTNDIAELTQAGLEALKDGGFAQALIQVVPMDDSTMEFGTDWGLGDQVAVVVEGTEYYSTVTGYAMRANSDGLKMGAILGDPAATPAPSTAQRITSVETRVSNLERNAEASTGGGGGPGPGTSSPTPFHGAKTATYTPGSLLVTQGTQRNFDANSMTFVKTSDSSAVLVKGWLTFATDTTVTPNTTTYVEPWFYVGDDTTLFGAGGVKVAASDRETVSFTWVIPAEGTWGASGALPAGTYECGMGIVVSRPPGAGTNGGPKIDVYASSFEIEELPAPPLPPGLIFYDSFTRTVADGLGTSYSGHTYTERGGYDMVGSVSGGYASINLGAYQIDGLELADMEVRINGLGVDTMPPGVDDYTSFTVTMREAGDYATEAHVIIQWRGDDTVLLTVGHMPWSLVGGSAMFVPGLTGDSEVDVLIKMIGSTMSVWVAPTGTLDSSSPPTKTHDLETVIAAGNIIIDAGIAYDGTDNVFIDEIKIKSLD